MLTDRDFGASGMGVGAVHNPSESERQFRLLINDVRNHALYTIDPEGIVVSWNAGAERVLGYTAAEIVGLHFSKFYTASERTDGVPMRALDSARAQGRFESESLRVRKDGAAFWADAVIEPIRDIDGELIGFTKIIYDISGRKRVQSELRRAEEFLRLVIESIPAAILVKDVKDRRFAMVNDAAEKLIGMPRAEIVGRTAEAIYPDDYAGLVRDEDEELLRLGELFIDDHTIELRGKSRVSLPLRARF